MGYHARDPRLRVNFSLTFRKSPLCITTKEIPEITRSEKVDIERDQVKAVFGCELDEICRQNVGLQAQRGIEVENIDEYIDKLTFDPDQDGCESVQSQSSSQDDGCQAPNLQTPLDRMIEDFELEMSPEHEGFFSKDLRQSQMVRSTLQPFCLSMETSPDRDQYLRTSAPLPWMANTCKPLRTECLSDTKFLEQDGELHDFEVHPPEITLFRHNSQACPELARDASRSRLLSEPVGGVEPTIKVELQSPLLPNIEGDPSTVSTTTGSANCNPQVCGKVSGPDLKCLQAQAEAQQSKNCY
jgi:hypothetical protein